MVDRPSHGVERLLRLPLRVPAASFFDRAGLGQRDAWHERQLVRVHVERGLHVFDFHVPSACALCCDKYDPSTSLPSCCSLLPLFSPPLAAPLPSFLF